MFVTRIVIVRSTVRPWFVVIRFVTEYGWPATPAESHIVVAVVVFVALFWVIPGERIHVEELIVSAFDSHADQSKP